MTIIKETYIIMYMKNKEKEFIRTTLWLPRDLHAKAKIMAIITRSSLSELMRSALTEKMKHLKENYETNISKRKL